MGQYMTLIDSINNAGMGLKKVLLYDEGVIVVNLTERKLCIFDNIVNFDKILDIRVSAETKTDPRVELANAFVASTSGKKTTTDTSSVIGRSIVGGVVAGAPGAIIGGLTADKKTEEYHHVDSSYQDYTIIIS